MSTKPTLRPLDFQAVTYQGRQMWYLRDPLSLSDQQLFMPMPLAQIVLYLDGAHDVQQIRAALSRDLGQELPLSLVEETLAQLDAACLLENERSRQASAVLLQQFRALPHRPPALAGHGYPATSSELRALFEQYEALASGPPLNGWDGHAVVSPHIDYERGGPVYAAVWRSAAPAVAQAELALIFGTDHNGGPGAITLTGLPYATPFGLLPAATEVVDALAAAIGPQRAFAQELNHRNEHSVELSAVWLHYTCQRLGRTPPPTVPILCGSFHHFVTNGGHPAADETIDAFVRALCRATAGRRVLVVASVDLAHVGPVFGDPPYEAEQRRRLAQSDRSLIDAMRSGDHERFYAEIAGVQDRHRICGFSATYLMLRYLQQRESPEGLQGVHIAYEQCSADEEEASFVSICGLLL